MTRFCVGFDLSVEAATHEEAAEIARHMVRNNPAVLGDEYSVEATDGEFPRIGRIITLPPLAEGTG